MSECGPLHCTRTAERDNSPVHDAVAAMLSVGATRHSMKNRSWSAFGWQPLLALSEENAIQFRAQQRAERGDVEPDQRGNACAKRSVEPGVVGDRASRTSRRPGSRGTTQRGGDGARHHPQPVFRALGAEVIERAEYGDAGEQARPPSAPCARERARRGAIRGRHCRPSSVRSGGRTRAPVWPAPAEPERWAPATARAGAAPRIPIRCAAADRRGEIPPSARASCPGRRRRSA